MSGLRGKANPGPRHDYLVRLEGGIGPVSVRVDWVPDLLVLTPAAFAADLAARSVEDGLEALALALLEDFNDALVPRWLQVSVELRSGGVVQRVVVEDRQPGWDSPALLGRLAPALP